VTNMPFIVAWFLDLIANLGLLLAGVGGLLAVRQYRQRPAAGAFIVPLLPAGLWLCVAGSVVQLMAWAVVSATAMPLPLLSMGRALQLMRVVAVSVVWSMLLWAVGVAVSGHGLIMTVRKALRSRGSRRRPT